MLSVQNYKLCVDGYGILTNIYLFYRNFIPDMVDYVYKIDLSYH